MNIEKLRYLLLWCTILNYGSRRPNIYPQTSALERQHDPRFHDLHWANQFHL